MTVFLYKARDKQNKLKTGTIEASNKQQVFELLKKYNLLGVSIAEKGEKSFLSKFSGLFSKVSLKSKVVFSRQLATMITSGLSIIQSLRILQEQEKTKNKKLWEILKSVTNDVESGITFSEALSKFPNVFSSIYVNLVKSGEVSGKLDEVLERLADQMEKDYDLRGKIKGAMTYPVFVVSVMVLVGGVVVMFVMPQLKTLFEESGSKLPFLTKLLLSTSDWARKFWWVIVLGSVGFVALIRYYLKSKKGRWVWDGFKLKIPIIGTLAKNIYMVRFARTLGTLISSGLSILDSLAIVSDVVGNVRYKDAINKISNQVENGISLSVPLEHSNLFPSMVSNMVEVGEKTGNVDKVLFKLSEFFDKEVNNAVVTLSTLLEPILLVIMGVGVGVFVGTILLPIYKLASDM